MQWKCCHEHNAEHEWSTTVVSSFELFISYWHLFCVCVCAQLLCPYIPVKECGQLYSSVNSLVFSCFLSHVTFTWESRKAKPSFFIILCSLGRYAWDVELTSDLARKKEVEVCWGLLGRLLVVLMKGIDWHKRWWHNSFLSSHFFVPWIWTSCYDLRQLSWDYEAIIIRERPKESQKYLLTLILLSC